MRRYRASYGLFRSVSMRLFRLRSWHWRSMSPASSCSVEGDTVITMDTDTFIPVMITAMTMHIGLKPSVMRCCSKYSRKARRPASGGRRKAVFHYARMRSQSRPCVLEAEDNCCYLESVDEVPKPHEFAALVRLNRSADVHS